jgi:hypothetical protein
MRFGINPNPNLGDKKFKKKFAIFPIKITETKKIWLENYYQHYVYANVMNYGSLDYGYHGEWCQDYRETLDFRYSSIVNITINQTDVEKRDKGLEDILRRI